MRIGASLEKGQRRPGPEPRAAASNVWGYYFDPTTNLVNVYVNSLREKLGSDVIETVRGVGYRLPGRAAA